MLVLSFQPSVFRTAQVERATGTDDVDSVLASCLAFQKRVDAIGRESSRQSRMEKCKEAEREKITETPLTMGNYRLSCADQKLNARLAQLVEQLTLNQ